MKGRKVLNTTEHTTETAVSLNDCNDGAGDRDRTGDIQLGKLAFYFPGIHKPFKFSRLPIMAIIPIFYGLRIPRTICTLEPVFMLLWTVWTA